MTSLRVPLLNEKNKLYGKGARAVIDLIGEYAPAAGGAGSSGESVETVTIDGDKEFTVPGIAPLQGFFFKRESAGNLTFDSDITWVSKGGAPTLPSEPGSTLLCVFVKSGDVFLGYTIATYNASALPSDAIPTGGYPLYAEPVIGGWINWEGKATGHQGIYFTREGSDEAGWTYTFSADGYPTALSNNNRGVDAYVKHITITPEQAKTMPKMGQGVVRANGVTAPLNTNTTVYFTANNPARFNVRGIGKMYSQVRFSALTVPAIGERTNGVLHTASDVFKVEVTPANAKLYIKPANAPTWKEIGSSTCVKMANDTEYYVALEVSTGASVSGTVIVEDH